MHSLLGGISSLAEVEKLLSSHQQIHEEIDSYANDYSSMMEYGEKVTANPSNLMILNISFLGKDLKR